MFEYRICMWSTFIENKTFELIGVPFQIHLEMYIVHVTVRIFITIFITYAHSIHVNDKFDTYTRYRGHFNEELLRRFTFSVWVSIQFFFSLCSVSFFLFSTINWDD